MAIKITSKVVAKKKNWEAVKKNLISAQNKSTDVGWWDGFHINDRSDGIPLAQIAQWVEEGHAPGAFGGMRTPPRPFMTVALEAALRQNGWLEKKVRANATLVFAKKLTWSGFFKKLGPDLVILVQGVMEELSNPSNSEVTVALKGFDNPTIETGHLLSKVDWRIAERKK
jgi:hypothetical protein